MGKKYKFIETKREYPKDCKQAFISNLISQILGVEPEKYKHPHFITKATQEFHHEYYDVFLIYLKILSGDLNLHLSKRTSPLSCDTYFPSPWNFIFEFDEVQHFSSYKGLLLQNYPEAPYGFEIDRYKFLCSTLKDRADKYRQSKEATEFPFKTGRTRQRAFLDSFKDVLPHLNSIDLNPTIRIDEFEVGDILDDFTENIEDSKAKLIEILIDHFQQANMDTQIELINRSVKFDNPL